MTSGTTWHAAGLVTQLRATRRMTGAALSPALVRRGGEGDGGYALFTLNEQDFAGLPGLQLLRPR